jgi:ABC-2 type transport system ATP-binding protein
MSNIDAKKKLNYWFEKFEIGDWWNKKVEELSKGMQQKIQFITTVLHEPELLIFDEPFSGFDPINVNLLKKEILALRDKGSTIIFSTHNMSSVEELCDHISLINESRTLLEGEVNEIRNRYKSDIISVGFEGDADNLRNKLNKRFAILSIDENGPGKEVKIKQPANANSNELISSLVELTKIKSYNEVLPGMNDIFIQVVEQASLKKARKS